MNNNSTIVIPNFNGEKFIMETIRLLRTGLPKIEIIVVDDASTDGSVTLLKTNKITVVERSVNGGFAATVNTGLKYIRTKDYAFALICNSDLVPSQKECISVSESASNFFPNQSVGIIGFLERDAFIPEEINSSDISGFLFWIRLEILNDIGYFDERFYMYGEETDFFRRVVASGHKIIQSGVQVSHAAEKSGKSKIMNSWFAIRNCIFLEAKNYRFIEASKKVLALLLVMLRIRGKTNDPSTIRVRRPGFVVGPLMLLAAIFWNIYQTYRQIRNRKLQ